MSLLVECAHLLYNFEGGNQWCGKSQNTSLDYAGYNKHESYDVWGL